MPQLNFYQRKIDLLSDELKKLKKKLLLFSWLRFFAFLPFLLFVILYFVNHHAFLYLILSLPFLILFVFLVLKYNAIDDNITFHSSKIEVNQNEIKYLNFDYLDKNGGEEFKKLNPFLTNDFDVFGAGSLFQYINRCNTKDGISKLAQNLAEPNIDSVLIKKKQAAIDELSKKTELIQDIQVISGFINENKYEKVVLKSWMKQEQSSFTTEHIVSFGIAILNIILLILASFNIFSWVYFTVSIIFSLFFVGRNKKKFITSFSQISNLAENISYYKNIFQILEDEKVESEYLQALQTSLNVNDTTASVAFKNLHKILGIYEIRNFPLLSYLLNAFFLLDIHSLYYLAKWKSEYNQHFMSWFDMFSELEMLISFATFSFNNKEHITIPKIEEHGFKIAAKNLGHPLINTTTRVNNDFELEGMPATLIITGANMAGKSTFLRTVAVNLILAMNGAPVVASQFTFSPCKILSSIKIQDSLLDEQSYFYAELLRLQEIVEYTEKNPKTLVILDEILRGTNTKDKQTGSLGFIEKLIHLNTPTIVATHDLVIGDLEKKYPGIAQNRCFEVELLDDQLSFDYKLKEGISQKLNASFLMKKMGIIE